MTNKERLDANNEKIKEIQKTLENKILKAQGEGEYFVKVIDYDGTILKEANLNNGDTFTLPKPPSHNGLVFQEWSCSQDIVDNKITIEDNNVMVGATYTTESGLNEFDVEITKAMETDIATNGYVVTLNMDGTKDWGDGTSDDLTTHTYYAYGNYTIKCNGTTMTTSSSSGLFGQTSAGNTYCSGVRLATATNIGTYAFAYCNSLKYITLSTSLINISSNAFYKCVLRYIIIPKSVTTIEAGILSNNDVLKNIVLSNGITYMNSTLFLNCYGLTDVVIPNSVTGMSANIFNRCYALTNIIIPKNVKTMINENFGNCSALRTITLYDNLKEFKSGTFNGCYSLESINLPSNITTIPSDAFQTCKSLRSITIPSSVTKIESQAFRNCYSLTFYDFSNLAQIPTISSTSFGGINSIAKIIVPDALYDEWVVATNWVTYANYIYKASEVQ